MTWTKKPPAAPGYYWHRYPGSSAPPVLYEVQQVTSMFVTLKAGSPQRISVRDALFASGEWAGPVFPPTGPADGGNLVEAFAQLREAAGPGVDDPDRWYCPDCKKLRTRCECPPEYVKELVAACKYATVGIETATAMGTANSEGLVAVHRALLAALAAAKLAIKDGVS